MIVDTGLCFDHGNGNFCIVLLYWYADQSLGKPVAFVTSSFFSFFFFFVLFFWEFVRKSRGLPISSLSSVGSLQSWQVGSFWTKFISFGVEWKFSLAFALYVNGRSFSNNNDEKCDRRAEEGTSTCCFVSVLNSFRNLFSRNCDCSAVCFQLPAVNIDSLPYTLCRIRRNFLCHVATVAARKVDDYKFLFFFSFLLVRRSKIQEKKESQTQRVCTRACPSATRSFIYRKIVLHSGFIVFATYLRLVYLRQETEARWKGIKTKF